MTAGEGRSTVVDGGRENDYQLWLHPVVLGSGKRMFREGRSTTTLRLVDTKTTSSGLVILTYEPAEKEDGNAA